MARDDWKHYDEDMEEAEADEVKPPPAEKQCGYCLHWVERGSPTCSWCGKPFEDYRDIE